MIEIKSRSESSELGILRSLFSRKELAEKEKQYYFNLKKGYEGEVLFDQHVAYFTDSWQFVNDLLLEQNNTFFQIDSLGICGDELYLFDVKNYEGDFIVENDKWKPIGGKEMRNPLHQLHRCESLLSHLLLENNLHFPIKAFLIFINPKFTLYQAPFNKAIVFPTQLDDFLFKLNIKSGRKTAKQTKLINLLSASHKTSYPNSFIPSYEYSELRKGIVCLECGGVMGTKKELKKVKCGSCDYFEDFENAVLRTIKEFQLLFPERKVTAQNIYEWCGQIWSRRTIQRILARNFTCIKHGKSTYYQNP